MISLQGLVEMLSVSERELLLSIKDWSRVWSRATSTGGLLLRCSLVQWKTYHVAG